MGASVHQRLSPSDAWELAYKESVTREPWDQVSYLLDHLGPRFTTASLGVTDARTVKRWRDERAEPRDRTAAARLQLLFRIVYAIVETYGRPSVAAGFLRSANPQLDDEAPMLLLADSDPVEVQRPLLAAVRAFLEG